MKGLELARDYYNEYGAAMLHEQFPEAEGLVAVGLTGSGSECFGYDDEVSEDHDFEPGFCIFLPDEDVVDRQTAFKMERAYSKLPKEYKGYKRAVMSPVGGDRHGVIRMSDFFMQKVGAADGILTVRQWIETPSYMLAEAVNGEIFRDDSGVFAKIRDGLSVIPEDIRLKKLAGNLLIMAQSGQYNYNRCISHGEKGAAQLAVFEFCQAATAAAFLINKKHMPYYKWQFRALRELPRLSETADCLESMISGGNDGEDAEFKYYAIEAVASLVIDELMNDGITKATCGDLEKHAYSVNDMIEDAEIRNMHILAAK